MGERLLTARLSLPPLPPSLRWAAYTYLAHVLLQGKVALSEITLALTLIFVGRAVATGQVAVRWHILYYPLALYGIVSSVSSLAAPQRMHAFGEIALWLKMMIIPAALTLFREIPRLRELALRAHAAFAGIIASYGIVQYLLLERRDLEHRITGPLTHVMTFSGMLMAESLLLLVVAVHLRKRWLYAVAALVTLPLLLTFTRSAWLGWALGVFVVLALSRSRWLAWAIPVAIFFVTFMPMAMFARLVSSFDVAQYSNFDRVRMLEGGVEMIRDYPLLGVGPANVKEMYPLYRRADAPRFRPPHLHNNVIQLWAERGVVAVAAYLLLLALFLRECARGRRGPARPWAEAGIAITVALAWAGLFEFNFGDTEVFLLMLELFALICATIEQSPNEAAPSLVATHAAAGARP